MAVSFKALASLLFSTAAGVDPEPNGGKSVPPRPVVVDLFRNKQEMKGTSHTYRIQQRDFPLP